MAVESYVCPKCGWDSVSGWNRRCPKCGEKNPNAPDLGLKVGQEVQVWEEWNGVWSPGVVIDPCMDNAGTIEVEFLGGRDGTTKTRIKFQADGSGFSSLFRMKAGGPGCLIALLAPLAALIKGVLT